ncbi:Ionotropic receptor 473 [Blattella germanica]|nr:Ionotropic receptor 473 [Blattella germanica]
MNMVFDGRFCLRILLLLVLKGCIKPLPLDLVSPVEDSLSRCIAKIANEYFNRDLPTALFIPYREYDSHSYISTNNSHVDYLVQSLHQRIDHPLVMLDYHNNPQSLHQKVKLGSYIIILSGEVGSYIDMAIYVILKIYEVAREMSASGRLLIATTGSPTFERDGIVGGLLRLIWKILQISEAIVLLPNIESTSVHDDVIEVYKWFPEEQDDPCMLSLNPFVLLDIWILKGDQFSRGKKLFQTDLITDMRGCTLNLSFLNYPPLVYTQDDVYVIGPLIDQIKLIIEAINLRLKIFRRNFTDFTNMKLPISLLNVKDNDFLTYGDCVVTYPYFKQNLKWVVPAGAPVPRWRGLIKIFNPLLWFCVVATFLIGSTTSWLLLNQNRQSQTYISALLDTLRTYVVAAISDRYKGTVASTFFVLWLFYCLIINTAYQSALISFLADPGRDEPIKTIAELHNSGLHLMSRVFILNEELENIGETEHYSGCTNQSHCLTRIAQNRDTALLDDELLLGLVINKYFGTETNRYLLHIIEEIAYKFYFTITVYSHGCLIFKRMEQLIHRVWSAGLIIRYFNDFYKIQRTAFYEVLNDDPYVITLSHLQGGFYFLICGLFVSTIVFLIEISYWSV